jgi:hypothetical protein
MINFPDAPGEGQLFTSGAASWVYTAGRWLAASTAAAKYVVGCFVPGVLTASQVLLVHRVAKAVTLPANFAAVAGYASQAGGTAAKALAASPTSFSNIGTITFAAGGTVPAFATSGGAAVAFAQGDVLRLAAPASADATFAGFSATVAMQEQ